MSSNGSPKYEDFLLPGPEETKLPSGMPVVLQYPTTRYFMSVASLPGNLARAIRDNASLADIKQADREDVIANLANEPMTAEQIEESDIRTNLMICDVFMEPKFSLTPTSPTEFHPSRLRPEDKLFVVEWVNRKLGSIGRGGSNDLETFRPKPSTDEPADSSVEVVGQTTG